MASMEEILLAKFQVVEAKLDEALAGNQDFKTWRRGHQEVHDRAERDGDREHNRIEGIATAAHQRADDAHERVTSKLGWRNFFVAVVTSLSTAAALIIAALALGVHP